MTMHIIDTRRTQARIAQGVDAEAFPCWNAHPLFGDFTRNLYPCVEKLATHNQDQTFCVMDDDTLHLICACTQNDDGLSHFGLPIVLATNTQASPKKQKQAMTAALDHLLELARNAPALKVLVLGSPTEKDLGPIDNTCINYFATPSARIHAMTGLCDGEHAIHKHLRKSFRSLVNWGKSNLSMTYINAANLDRERLDEYAKFHTTISGGQTYSTSYWDVIWGEIVDGRGELSLGYLDDGTLASGTFITSAKSTAYYTSGVYDRENFDKPLGHFPLYDAMVRAAERGNEKFDLGEIVPKNSASTKESQIGFFKKGFCEKCELTLTWTLTPG